METQYTQPNQNKMVYLILSHVRQKWEILALFGWWKHYHSSLKYHHSSLITQYLITYHLKIPKLHPKHVWHYNLVRVFILKTQNTHLYVRLTD